MFRQTSISHFYMKTYSKYSLQHSFTEYNYLIPSLCACLLNNILKQTLYFWTEHFNLQKSFLVKKVQQLKKYTSHKFDCERNSTEQHCMVLCYRLLMHPVCVYATVSYTHWRHVHNQMYMLCPRIIPKTPVFNKPTEGPDGFYKHALQLTLLH